jgi:hypothetical protein
MDWWSSAVHLVQCLAWIPRLARKESFHINCYFVGHANYSHLSRSPTLHNINSWFMIVEGGVTTTLYLYSEERRFEIGRRTGYSDQTFQWILSPTLHIVILPQCDHYLFPSKSFPFHRPSWLRHDIAWENDLSLPNPQEKLSHKSGIQSQWEVLNIILVFPLTWSSRFICIPRSTLHLMQISRYVTSNSDFVVLIAGSSLCQHC